MSSNKEYWVYHERQQGMLCGQHALNNLVQAAVFTPDMLADIAHQLDALELQYMAQNEEGGTRSKDYLRRAAEGSGNVDESGNFSIEVLRSALLNRYNLNLPNIRQEGVLNESTTRGTKQRDVTDIDGFICHRDSHWFAIRKINGRYWNLNSTQDRPQLISHFRLAAEIEGLQNGGYSVFCIIDGGLLPQPCTSSRELPRGLPQYWWKEEDLVRGKSDAVTGATDPWKGVGEGIRLDGKPAAAASSSGGGSMFGGGAGGSSSAHVDGLTEAEMLEMALAASLQQHTDGSDGMGGMSQDPAPPVALTAEPPAGMKGTCRIQFRLPTANSRRVVRRFYSSDPVGMLYAYVEEESPSPMGSGGVLELRAGFPPADLSSKRLESIEDANLAGESVQCRYV